MVRSLHFFRIGVELLHLIREKVMKALCWHGTSDVRVDNVPDPRIEDPCDAIVKITRSGICGSDLHLLNGYMPTMEKGDILGHEPMGIVVEVGRDQAVAEVRVRGVVVRARLVVDEQQRARIRAVKGDQGAGIRGGAGSQATLTDQDATAIREQIPEVQYVAAGTRGNSQLVYAENNWSTSWQGVQPDFFEINDTKRIARTAAKRIPRFTLTALGATGTA